PLSGEHHRYAGFVAGFNHFPVPHRAARLDDRLYALANPDVHTVSEREKGVRNHCRAYQAGPVLAGESIDLLFLLSGTLSPLYGKLQVLVRDFVPVETERVGVLLVCLVDGDFSDPYPV